MRVTFTQETPWRAGRFWWDWTGPRAGAEFGLRALIFDLDALTDVECGGHRVAFNAAFAAHGLDIEWSVPRYRRLLALRDERQRVAAELRARGICTECDVLFALLVDDICATKAMLVEETMLDADLTPRPGLLDLLTEAFTAGVSVAVVTDGDRSWAAPLVRHLVGDGLVEIIVTADDVATPALERDAYDHALAELGVPAEAALAVAGSAAGLRAATVAELATVVVTGDGAPDLPAAMAVRADYGGSEPLRVADCQRLHGRWWAARKRTAA